MLRLLFLPALTIVVLAASACSGGDEANPRDDEASDQARESAADLDANVRLETGAATGTPAATAVLQSPNDALTQDLELIAKANGWTMEEAAANHRAADVVGRIAVQVFEERRDMFVGSALSEAPGGAPLLYIKGPADEFIRDLIASAEIEIKIVDRQPYSFDELEARQSMVSQALQGMGFRNFGVESDIQNRGRIEAAVTRPGGIA